MQRLDIRSVFRLLLSRMRMLLIFAVIFAVLFGAVTYLFVPDTYASGVSVYVSSLASAADKQVASYSSLNSAEWLVLTYAEILQNRVTLQKVLPKLSRHLTEAELAERQVLREEYIAAFRASMQAHLDNMYYLDEHGNERKIERRSDRTH